jgi:hypothetical protein
LTNLHNKLKLGYDRGCRVMKARRLVASGSYGPDQLKALGRAFDDAWGGIAPTVSARPKAVEAARFRLAEIILSLARNGNFDPQLLADEALQVMRSRSSHDQP